jgi:hypothetical protein
MKCGRLDGVSKGVIGDRERGGERLLSAMRVGGDEGELV